MTLKVVSLKDIKASVAEGLRAIADDYENGIYGNDHATMVIGTNVFHFGTLRDTEGVVNALWDLQIGTHRLMATALTTVE
jgi:hypothetical protein